MHWKYLCYFYLHSKWELKMLKQSKTTQPLKTDSGHRRCSITIYLKSVETFNASVIILWTVTLKTNNSNSSWKYYFLQLLGCVQQKEIMCQINSSHKILWDLQVHEERNVFHEFFNDSATYFGARPMAPFPCVHNLDPSSLLKQAQLLWGSRERKSKNS